MKKVKLLLVSFLLLGLTGCFSMKTDLKINEDKSMDFRFEYTIDMSAAEDMMGSMEFTPSDDDATIEDDYDYSDDFDFDFDFGDDFDFDDDFDDDYSDDDYFNTPEIPSISQEEFEQKGYTIDTLENENGVSITISKKFASIDDVTAKQKGEFDFNNWMSTADDTNMFYLDGKNYVANWKYDLTSEDGADYSSVASMFDITYTVTLPKPSVSNNATTVSEDGKTLTWNLKYGELNNVQYTFSFAEDMTMYYIIGGAALFAIIIISLIITIIRSGKKHKQTPTLNQVEPVVEPVAPVMPVEPVQQVEEVPTVEPVVDENIAMLEPTPQPVAEPQPTFIQPTAETQPVAEPQPTVEQPQAPVAEQPVFIQPTVEQPVQPVVEEQPIFIQPAVEEPVQPTVNPQPAQQGPVSLEQLMNQQPIDNNQNNA